MQHLTWHDVIQALQDQRPDILGFELEQGINVRKNVSNRRHEVGLSFSYRAQWRGRASSPIFPSGVDRRWRCMWHTQIPLVSVLCGPKIVRNLGAAGRKSPGRTRPRESVVAAPSKPASSPNSRWSAARRARIAQGWAGPETVRGGRLWGCLQESMWLKTRWRWRYRRGRNGAAPTTREGSRFWSSAWRRRTRRWWCWKQPAVTKRNCWPR